MRKVIEQDGDIKEVFHHDAHDGASYISRVQDVTPYLEQAHRARSSRGEHSGYKSEVFNKKASIPTTVMQKWCKDRGITAQQFLNDENILKLFLNDPDNKAFLHIPGKV